MLLALTLFGQQILDPRTLPIPPAELKPPILAGVQEIVLGVQPQSSRTYSLFMNQLDSGKYGDKIPINYQDVRIGQTTWTVSPGVYGSTSCLALETSASRNQAWEYRKFIYELRHRATRTWYISEAGKLLGETCDLELATGRWTMDVAYGIDDYTVTFSAPNKPKRTQTVTPGCGIEALTLDPFKPMLKPGVGGAKLEVLLKEKEFYILDPMTVSPVKHKALAVGTFSGELFNRKWTGREVEITGGKETQKVWIADDGRFMRMNLPNGVYLMIEQL
jgi:hypothetical protein